MKLFDFQKKIINEISLRHENKSRRVAVKSPCGSGKTIIACKYIEMMLKAGKRSLFIADRIELINQTSEKFFANGVNHGIIQAGNKAFQPSAKVHIASVQTLSRRKIVPDVDLIIIDEFHSSYEYNNWLLGMNKFNFVGLSATPFSKGIGKYWDGMVIGPTVKDLTEMGRLKKAVTYSPFVFDLSGVARQAGEYNNKQLDVKINKKSIIADVLDSWVKLGENRQTIGFAINVAHAKELAERFNKNGISAESINWRTPDDERNDILERFKQGLIRVIFNVDILSKGYDQPEVSCIIDAAPTLVLSKHIQKLGRGGRYYPGIEDYIILDHAGNTCRHGDVDSPTPDFLDSGDKRQLKKTEKEYKKSLERICHKCKIVKPMYSGKQCQSCGYIPPDINRLSKVETRPGILMKSVDGKHTKSREEWLGMLIWYGKFKERKDGWAMHAFKSKFREWPTNLERLNCIQEPPDHEVKKYMKYLQIKLINSKRK